MHRLVLLTDVLRLAAGRDALAEVARDAAREALHHHGEQRARQRRVPPPLARLVADERVLRLHLDKLGSVRTIRWSTHGEGDAGVVERVSNQRAAGAVDVRVLMSAEKERDSKAAVRRCLKCAQEK